MRLTGPNVELLSSAARDKAIGELSFYVRLKAPKRSSYWGQV